MAKILFFKSLGPGEHWITAKPPGHQTGQPILVRDMPDGSMKVIGGAGGSLNHHRFRPRAEGEDRKQAAAKRQEDIKAKRKKQIKADKAAGLHDAKQPYRP